MIIHRICLSKADSTQKHSPTAKSCLFPKRWIVREIVKSYFTAGNQSFWEILGGKCEKVGFCLSPGFTWCGFRSAAPAVNFFAAFSENRGTPCQGWSYLWAFGIEVEERKRSRERWRGGKSKIVLAKKFLDREIPGDTASIIYWSQKNLEPLSPNGLRCQWVWCNPCDLLWFYYNRCVIS